jgi:hypothetical protein
MVLSEEMNFLWRPTRDDVHYMGLGVVEEPVWGS